MNHMRILVLNARQSYLAEEKFKGLKMMPRSAKVTEVRRDYGAINPKKLQFQSI